MSAWKKICSNCERTCQRFPSTQATLLQSSQSCARMLHPGCLVPVQASFMGHRCCISPVQFDHKGVFLPLLQYAGARSFSLIKVSRTLSTSVVTLGAHGPVRPSKRPSSYFESALQGAWRSLTICLLLFLHAVTPGHVR